MISKRLLSSPQLLFMRVKQFSKTCNLQLITKAEPGNSGSFLKVEFGSGEIHNYPSSFLQDNCTCEKCFHAFSCSRSRRMTELNLKNRITKAEFTSEKVKCIWSDGHESIFPEKWLKERRFSEDNINFRKKGLRDNPTLIGADHVIYKDNYEAVMNDKSALVGVLKTLCKVGIALIEGAKLEIGQLRKIANKIGFIRPTHYGYEFTVKSEKNPVNMAYTPETLCIHTDLPYYQYPPGVQMLHCIKQYQRDDGGRSRLVDGFNVAEQMRTNHPKHFKTLCQIPVEFYDIGADYIDFHKVHHSPTFVLNPDTNELTRINYSNQQLSSFQPIPLDKVDDVYESLKLFTDLCYKPENLIQFKLKEGDVLIFDNWRILHGREGFDPTFEERHLEGCYVDWDEIFSRIRVIEADLNLKN